MKNALLLVYTGSGKGKTTAAVGQVVRAVGQGLETAFGQFLKRAGEAGEQAMLAELLGPRFLAGGLGFYRRKEDFEEHRSAAQAVLTWAREQIEDGVGLLALDEALYALHLGMVTEAELTPLVELARSRNCHVVLTGRQLPPWLERMADLVTTMEETKHPFQRGLGAVRGIEF